MLGHDGDDVLAVLFGSEKGRPFYAQLIETARVGGVAEHLIAKARRLYLELTLSRGWFEIAQRRAVELMNEEDQTPDGAIIEGEATEL
jgi:hypothetical protein